MSDSPEPVNPFAEGSTWGVSALVQLTDRASMFMEVAADRLELNVTDLRCLALAASEQHMTATRLADLSGLTSGAITGVLDRLERAGFLAREADPSDRRRTLVRVRVDRLAEVEAVYEPLVRTVSAAIEGYGDEVREGVDAFFNQLADAYSVETSRLRASTHGGMVGEMFTAPIGDATSGRLVFKSGAPRVSLRAAPFGPASEAKVVAELASSTLRIGGAVQPGELLRGTFGGPVPTVRSRAGLIAVHHKLRFDWRERSAQLALTGEVPWTIEISGGLSRLAADLSGLRVHGMELRGGVDTIDLLLPRPDGTSRIELSGGVSSLSIRHAPDAAVLLTLNGGVHQVRFGSQRLRQVHGTLRLETPSARSSADRYEITIGGGARDVSVAEQREG
jgi:DNA-binding MarR family transcriptional regulator